MCAFLSALDVCLECGRYDNAVLARYRDGATSLQVRTFRKNPPEVFQGTDLDPLGRQSLQYCVQYCVQYCLQFGRQFRRQFRRQLGCRELRFEELFRRQACRRSTKSAAAPNNSAF